MHKRPSRSYDSTVPTGKKIQDLLGDILSGISGKSGQEREDISKVWMSLMGDKMAGFTQVVSWKNGILTIKVKSATLYALLTTYEKPRLLKALQQKFQINEIVFRVG